MTDHQDQPVIFVFAGPNGSGKTTVTHSIPIFGVYINADDLKKEYNLSDLEAAQKADILRNELLDIRSDFSFETVLSTEKNLILLQKAKAQGYEVQCVYVLTNDVNINVARVKRRHALGGHDVPEDKIRSRYHKALALLPQLIDVCDKILIYDNSNDTPSVIFSKEYGYSAISPNNRWSEPALRKLLGM
jgi:predicted ABC-type ATPase